MTSGQRARLCACAQVSLGTLVCLALLAQAGAASAESTGGVAQTGLAATSQPASQPTTQPTSSAMPSTLPNPQETTAAPGASRRAHVVFTSDLYGRFAWPGCGRRATHRAELAHLVTGARTLALKSKLDGAGRPLILGGGSMLRLDVFGSYVFHKDGQPPVRLAKLIDRVGFDAVSVGPHDWGARPGTLGRYAALMRLSGARLLSGNVTCRDQVDRRCRGLGGPKGRRYLMVQRGGLRMGVLSVVRADMASRILARSREGLVVADPVEWSRATIRRLRQQEAADFIVVLANLNSEGDAPQPVLEFVRQLGPDAPDLVLANAMYESGRDAFVQHLRRGRTLIVGTDRFGQHLGDVTIDYRRGDQGVEIEQVDVRHYPTTDFEARPADAAVLDTLMQGMCRDLDRPLGNARLAHPTSHDDFLQLAMQVMRQRARAEVAVLDAHSIADTSFPMSGRLTWEKVLRALRGDTTVGWVTVRGERLKALLDRYVGVDDAPLRVLGVSRKGSNWSINGRSLLTGHGYRVATTRFVASGGEQLVTLNSREEFRDGGESLRQLLGRYLEDRGRRGEDRASIDLDTDFADLGNRWLLRGSVDLGLLFSNVAINNTGANGNRYSLPLLQRDPLTSLAAEFRSRAGASTRDHLLDSDVHLQYGQTCTAGFAECAESNDQITGALTYAWRRLRNTWGRGHWYVPEPFVQARLNTEFTPGGSFERCLDEDVDIDACPEDRKATETFHYMDLSGIGGVALSLHPLLLVKVGAVVRGEVLTPEERNPDIPLGPGFYLGYVLQRVSFFAASHHPLQLESELHFYLTDITGRRGTELNWQTKVFFELAWRLNLTASHRFYLFGTVDDDLSIANDISLGISLLFDGRRQTF